MSFRVWVCFRNAPDKFPRGQDTRSAWSWPSLLCKSDFGQEDALSSQGLCRAQLNLTLSDTKLMISVCVLGWPLLGGTHFDIWHPAGARMLTASTDPSLGPQDRNLLPRPGSRPYLAMIVQPAARWLALKKCFWTEQKLRNPQHLSHVFWFSSPFVRLPDTIYSLNNCFKNVSSIRLQVPT